MFPGLTSVRNWDQADGDAMLMLGVADDSFDCVASSHCLEHLYDPYKALDNWVRICRPGGYLVIVVPDFAQYEQGFWPSRFNADHKWSFSISGRATHANHVILLNELALFSLVDVIKLELVERGYVYGVPAYDQSLSAACEPAIELILRKR
jgi:SAM-dependent methyltransferase